MCVDMVYEQQRMRGKGRENRKRKSRMCQFSMPSCCNSSGLGQNRENSDVSVKFTVLIC
jgi:hypothetical protein